MKRNAKQIILELSRKKNLNSFDALTLYMLLFYHPYEDITFIKFFIDNYYDISPMPEEFYRMISYHIHSGNHRKLFNVLYHKNIYYLISFLKDDEKPCDTIEHIAPILYFETPMNKIKPILELVKKLDIKNDSIKIKQDLVSNPFWKLRKGAITDDNELRRIAIIMYLSIGLDNAIDLLSFKYGLVDLDMIFYLFDGLIVMDKDAKSIEVFRNFFFNNKKDINNNMRLMLDGKLNDIFINFDYFFNSIEYYIDKLGTNINRNKLSILLKERFLAPRLENPEISGELLEDMISSYRNKYDINDSESEIINKNIDAYNGKLKSKTNSSIKQVEIPTVGEYSFEMIPLTDARNLVMGYRAGNCFRLNGDAFVLFNKFLSNPHMRLLSISTEEYKDFGMVLLMRNGNVLIAQGIETSKRVPNDLLGEKLYLAVQKAMKYIMDRINEEDDEIVASIIGLTNTNTSLYNHNILPFIINPILDDNHQYYNGVDSYQGLLSLKNGKNINDIKLFVPNKFYTDKRNKIWKRDNKTPHNSFEYRMIEKIMISLRYARFKSTSSEEMIYYYSDLSKKREVYTVCTYNWVITVFEDGTIDSFINSNDPDIICEYELELDKINKRDITR